MIPINLLIKKTIKIYNQSSVLEPVSENHCIRDDKGIWSKIVFECIGRFNKKRVSQFIHFGNIIDNYIEKNF